MIKYLLINNVLVPYDTKKEAEIQYMRRHADKYQIPVEERDVEEVQLLQGNFYDWNMNYRMYIEGHENVLRFLTMWQPIYKDTFPSIILVIPRQTGKTTLLAGRLAYNGTSKKNFNTTYVTFSDESLRSFVNDKFKDSLLHFENPEIYRLVKRSGEKMGQLHRVEYFTGSKNNFVTHAGDMHHIEGKSVDDLILDELQNLNLEAYVKAKEAQAWTQGSELLAGIGGFIGTTHHDYWLDSNQQKWKYLNADWRDKLDFNKDGLIWGDYMIDYLKGMYEAKVPENWERHGYTFTQEDMPNIPLKKIDAIEKYHVPISASIEYKIQKYPDSWLQRHVYASFIQGELKPLIASQVIACFDKNSTWTKGSEVDHTKGLVVVSADWGGGSKAYTIFHVIQWIDEDIPIAKLLYLEKNEDKDVERQADKFANLMDSYEADVGSTDAGGGTRQVQKLEKRYGSRFMKNSYLKRPAQVLPSKDELRKLKKENRFFVDRSFALENIFDLIKKHHEFNGYSFPRYQIPAMHNDDLTWYVDHLTADEGHLIKVQGQDYTDYDHPDNQPDDGLHSLLYNWTGFIAKRKNKTWWASFN